MGLKIIAFLWGLAEATVFFIVPDVLSSFAGVSRQRTGLVACFYALAGALAGGVIMYLAGKYALAAMLPVMDAIPAISPAMMARVAGSLAENGTGAVLYGPLSGTPYKLYAVYAASSGISLAAFLAISVPARLTRFVLVTSISHYGLYGLHLVWPRLNRHVLLGLAWLDFYAFYFFVMPG